MDHLVPPGAREEYVDVGVGRLRVLRAGGARPGPAPLVLLHGSGPDGAAVSWYRLLEPLSADRRVWALDLPGWGGSLEAGPVGGPRELAAVVDEAMGALGVERAVVAGVSMGGDIALNLALEHPERVAGLVLVAPAGLVPRLRDRFTQAGAWAAVHTPDPLVLPVLRAVDRYFPEMSVRAVVRNPSAIPAPVVEEFTRLIRRPGSQLGHLGYNRATVGRRGMLNDLSGRVHRIGVPALFFHGEDDPLVDPRGSRRAARLMPRARLVTVPDCGHWAQVECHDRFLAEVRAFLGAEDL
ncbi:alpha/beta fold hydrolase [Nocardiopsis sp. NPDC006139]|uniref:alpha/beta fold hydrolase n=1 Tax=Nocardiopsis sp. NPDC006139 TaxID=3154578 RepID=UPI0033BBBC04